MHGHAALQERPLRRSRRAPQRQRPCRWSGDDAPGWAGGRIVLQHPAEARLHAAARQQSRGSMAGMASTGSRTVHAGPTARGPGDTRDERASSAMGHGACHLSSRGGRLQRTAAGLPSGRRQSHVPSPQGASPRAAAPGTATQRLYGVLTTLSNVHARPAARQRRPVARDRCPEPREWAGAITPSPPDRVMPRALAARRRIAALRPPFSPHLPCTRPRPRRPAFLRSPG